MTYFRQKHEGERNFLPVPENFTPYYVGKEHCLGIGQNQYVICRLAPGGAMTRTEQAFELSDDGWAAAWAQFSAMEPAAKKVDINTSPVNSSVPFTQTSAARFNVTTGNLTKPNWNLSAYERPPVFEGGNTFKIKEQFNIRKKWDVVVLFSVALCCVGLLARVFLYHDTHIPVEYVIGGKSLIDLIRAGVYVFFSLSLIVALIGHRRVLKSEGREKGLFVAALVIFISIGFLLFGLYIDLSSQFNSLFKNL